MRSTVTTLGEIEVLNPRGERVKLSSLWSDGPTVAVWLRHFGCMYCLEQAAVLMAALPRLQSAGGSLLFIGNGSPEQAMRFQQLKTPGARVVTDPDRTSYRALGAHRSPLRLLGRGLLDGWWNARKLHVRQEGLQGDALQLGAALVVEPPGRVLLTHINSSLGDHPSVEALVKALGRATGAQATAPAKATV
ncbi:MAG: peroxiredoxin-like family protein [Candidatus Dormibacteria bacterium]